MATTSNPKPLILPSQVTFRSEDKSGGKKYLCSRNLDGGWPYHRFESGLEIGDPRVAYEVFRMPNGNYRIKSLYFDKFWRRSPNWIWGDAEDNKKKDRDTMFECILISDNVIALRNLGNNAFCGALTTEGKTDCLNARYPTMTKEARLIVEERVMKREISNVRYRLPASKIKDRQVIVLAEKIIENIESPVALEDQVTFSEKIDKTTSWNNSISVNCGVKTSFEVSEIPFMVGQKVELSVSTGYVHQWGGSQKAERAMQISDKMVVPALTNMKVSLLCTKASCDVPFSYTQTDLLPNGRKVSVDKDDGIYLGVDAYEFKIKVVQIDKNGRELKPAKVEPANVTSEKIIRKKK